MGKELSIEKGIRACVANRLIFAAYRLPGAFKKHIIIQEGNRPLELKSTSDIFLRKGFVVHPFDSASQKVFFIKSDFYANDSISEDVFHAIQKLPGIETEMQQEAPVEADKQEYMQLLEKVKGVCAQGKLSKIVLSRVQLKEGACHPIVGDIFESLCEKYATAFVFVFSLGKDLWIGASPEPFLVSTEGMIQTTSVAGTKAYTEKNMTDSWNDKELEEQAIVTNYITQVLEKFEVHKYQQEGPYAKKAGNLIHLRTDFRFHNQLKPEKLGEFVAELHPTPAVCGYSKQGAFDFILQNELHQREYYAGFLGPVNSSNDFSLFVNLRSMKILKNNLALFVGGGITSGSNPEDEWNETAMKAETLLSVLPKMS